MFFPQIESQQLATNSLSSAPVTWLHALNPLPRVGDVDRREGEALNGTLVLILGFGKVKNQELTLCSRHVAALAKVGEVEREGGGD